MKTQTPVFTLFLCILACHDNAETKRIPMEILSAGVLTCVNTPTAVTCFGGDFPETWDGQSLPSSSVVLHRPSRKALLVGDVLVCLADGECFGDPMIGPRRIAETILTPIDWHNWSVVVSGSSIICGLNHEGSVKCWGQGLGLFSELPLHQPEGKFNQISIGFAHICGSNAEGVKCQPLLGDAPNSDEQSDLYGLFPEYTDACSGRIINCARRKSDSGEIRCWHDQGVHSDFSGVGEYDCKGAHVCINRGTRVECHARGKETTVFEIKIKQLSMGAQHFCGIDENAQLACRVFGDVSQFKEYRLIEPLSLQSWREISGK